MHYNENDPIQKELYEKLERAELEYERDLASGDVHRWVLEAEDVVAGMTEADWERYCSERGRDS